jgi:hypothetical protein
MFCWSALTGQTKRRNTAGTLRDMAAKIGWEKYKNIDKINFNDIIYKYGGN